MVFLNNNIEYGRFQKAVQGITVLNEKQIRKFWHKFKKGIFKNEININLFFPEFIETIFEGQEIWILKEWVIFEENAEI
jgi:hypothetical protein